MGVKKDARGLFTDIQKTINLECVFTDLNKIEKDNDGNEKLILNPLSTQASILEKVFKKEIEENNIEVQNILICHSQGCVVGSIGNLEKIEKVIFLAPPTNNDINKTFERFATRPGSVMDLGGESVVMRSDGSKTIIPATYWSDRKEMNYLEMYKNLSDRLGSENLKIILANQDEIVSNEGKEFLKTIGEVFAIDGNHNFEGESREFLLEKIKEII